MHACTYKGMHAARLFLIRAASAVEAPWLRWLLASLLLQPGLP